MKNKTILVSHWKNLNGSDTAEELTHNETQTSGQVINSDIELDANKNCTIENPPNTFIDKLFPDLIPTFKWRQKAIRRNFLNDFFLGFAFVYPILGLLEVLTHKVYWRQISVFALSYSAIFLTIGAIYYVVVLPILLAWAVMTLGPLGFLLAHIQWLLQTNALTAIVCRKIILTYISYQIFDTTLYLHGQKDFLLNAKFISASSYANDQVHWSRVEFWTTVVPLWTLNLSRKLLITVSLTGISLIPLIGPSIVNQLISSKRAYSYMNRYFILNGTDPKTARNYQYEHLGLFYNFGMAAGILEFLPVFSIITMTSNTVGAARWSIDIIKKKRS